MPIYEFHCTRCNTIYSFRSHTVNTEKRPLCPRCTTDTLDRRISSFAVLHSERLKADDAMDDLPLDDAQLERAFESLGGEMEHLDEGNPRALAQVMRKLAQATGMEYNDRMEEMVRRLEAGENPDTVEQDYGDLGEDDNPFEFIRKRGRSGASARPRRDDFLYDM
jgi:putative FmdB family regulatory protein